jgi:hypothetical protein
MSLLSWLYCWDAWVAFVLRVLSVEFFRNLFQNWGNDEYLFFPDSDWIDLLDIDAGFFLQEKLIDSNQENKILYDNLVDNITYYNGFMLAGSRQNIFDTSKRSVKKDERNEINYSISSMHLKPSRLGCVRGRRSACGNYGK